MAQSFWKERKVFLTGHTGFKGGWLALWLQALGSRVTGFSLPPPTTPSLFEAAAIGKGMDSVSGDIRNHDALTDCLTRSEPEIVLHLAAQAVVRESYVQPVATYATNVLGTVHLLEAIRKCPSVRAVVVVTSDKCYENREWTWAYRENDHLGGHDPYSSSKACAEMVTAAYRKSFFGREGSALIATVRAGNVIGGGDWAQDRLLPDLARSVAAKQSVVIRKPNAVRPWQHVLDPLNGYLVLAEHLHNRTRGSADAWNFGPSSSEAKPVSWVVDRALHHWGNPVQAEYTPQESSVLHEANDLRLDSTRARAHLGWRPKLGADEAIAWAVHWYRTVLSDGFTAARPMTEQQIERFMAL